MIRTRRVAAVAVAAAIGLGSVSVSAMGAAEWSKTRCLSYEKAFLKRNPHATKARKAKGNKVLQIHGCTLRIK
jgi:hypothetical protein